MSVSKTVGRGSSPWRGAIYGVVSVMVAPNSVKVIARDRYPYSTPDAQVAEWPNATDCKSVKS